jgi:SAM-dependent methyltransferase
LSRLNDPADVRTQYADESNLAARKSLYATGVVEGPDAREVTFRAIAEIAPQRVIEVGGGEGELALRIVDELGSELTFLDQSERMVEIARGKGIDAQVGDAQTLRFPDESFDCAVAAWMLYHLPDVPLALSELARVLRPGGRLVAVTNGREHLRELKDLAGDSWFKNNPFTNEDAVELLGAAFSVVEARDCSGWVTVETDDAIRAYLRSMSSGGPEQLPPHDLPLRIRRLPTVFVATK